MDLHHDTNVIKLCRHFDKYKRHNEENKLVVERFLENLKSNYSKKDDFFIKNSTFIGTGSSYEGTVSSNSCDFDIAMVLPDPFTMDRYDCVVKKPGLYMLKNTHATIYLEKFLTRKKFLHVESLRNMIFDELSTALRNEIFEKYKVCCVFSRRPFCSSFCVKLKYSKYFIKIDIVPQIKGRISDLTGRKNVTLPNVIQDYIEKNDMHVLFNLSSPPTLNDDSCKHLIVQPSFNLLEKVAMLNSDTVKYSVCITKAVYKHYKWGTKGLRSFHIKRVALFFYKHIDSSNDPWYGYMLIMSQIITMLEKGKIDGFFIAGQNIICKDKAECLMLATEMKGVLDSTLPSIILRNIEGTPTRTTIVPDNTFNGSNVHPVPSPRLPKPIFSGDSFSQSDKMLGITRTTIVSDNTFNGPTVHPVPSPRLPKLISSGGTPTRTTRACNNTFNGPTVHPVPSPRLPKPISSGESFNRSVQRLGITSTTIESDNKFNGSNVHPDPSPKSPKPISSGGTRTKTTRASYNTFNGPTVRPIPSTRSSEIISSDDVFIQIDEMFDRLNISMVESQQPRVRDTPRGRASQRSPELSSPRESTKSKCSNICSWVNRVISRVVSWINRP